MIAKPHGLSPFLRAWGVLLTASALAAHASSLSLSFNNPPSGTVTNGMQVPVNVAATTSGAPVIVSATLNFRTWAPLCTNLWNSLVLVTNTAPTNFTAAIPLLPAGNVDYYATCTYVDGVATSTVVSATNTYTVGTNMATVRQETFESGWTNYTGWSADSAGWWGTNAFAYNNKTGNKPNGSSYFLYLYNWNAAGISTNTQLLSPVLAEGIGSIYFEAVLRNAGFSASFSVQTWTNGASSWNEVTNYTLTTSTVITQALSCGIYAPARVRFVRTTFDSGDSVNASAIVLDNIRVSPPAADLQFPLPQATNSAAFSPAAPLAPVTIWCMVQDATTNEPTINQRLTLFYTWVSNDGTTTNSSSLGTTNVPGIPGEYAAVVSGFLPGTNRYYFRCAFDGYYYTNSDKRGPYYLSADGQTSTNHTPTNTFQYTIAVQSVSAIRLQPSDNLACGLCATGNTSTSTLLICNDGNSPLTVSNIVFGGSTFSSSFTTNFSVAATGTQSVQVTFAPSSIGPYSDTLQVLSDATMGSNTVQVSGTGMPMEWVSPPTVTGPAVGAVNQALSFVLSPVATDNWGYAVQNSFDWGDGTTSPWNTSTGASHVWTNSGSFNVRAQGRSATNSNVLSDGSAFLSVTITNTHIIGLQGSLAFGTVVTNLTASQTLTVTNGGTSPLNVSNITCANSAFAIVPPTSFSLPPSGATNVTVTFAPVAPGAYAGTVVVTSDAAAGVNTAPVSGFAEMIGKPTISPMNTTGAVAQAISFTASATNNTGDGISYRFDWGDGATSPWTNATVSHAWNAATTFIIRAQARCQTLTNAVSVWSDAATLAITNTGSLSLSASLLSFGDLMTNQTQNIILTVSNSANVAFHVTSIACPGMFSAQPQAFTLPASNSVFVTNTFAPTALGSYSGTATINSSDAGTRTYTVTGFCEMVSVPVLSGALAGNTNDTLAFGAFSTNNNSGHAIQYRFSWGDGSPTSNWTAASTTIAPTTHVWTTVGAYPVLVQAQCATDTNVISAWSAANIVNIYAAPVITFAPITNGLPFQANVNFNGAAVSNAVFYFLPPGSTNAQPANLTYVSGSLWTATIPPLNSGSMAYFLQYMLSGVPLRYPALTNLSQPIPNDLGPVRLEDFQSGWVNSTNGTWSTNNAGWTGTNLNVGYVSTKAKPNTSGSFLYLENANASGVVTNSFLQSPVFAKGIGSIYFEAIIANANSSANLQVQVSTNGGASYVDVGDFHIAGSQASHCQIVLNLRQSALVNLVRTSFTSGDTVNDSEIVLDNLVVSQPPTDVLITESLHNPGYPNSKDPVFVRCQVADVDPANAPSVSRSLTVYYQYKTSAGVLSPLSSTNMYPTGGNTYEGIIPAYPQGVMSYYFKCDFTGYYYSNNVTTTSPFYPSENLSPAYLPDQRTGGSGPFPVLAKYPAPGTAGSPGIPTYQINVFRSAASGMTLQTTPAVPSRQQTMTLVDDYTWQGQILMQDSVSKQNITNLTWFFIEANHYSNNATAFNAPISWGDTNQDFSNPPLGGTADLTTDPLYALKATLDYNGFLVFRLNTTNQNYLVRRAAYQDFNVWPADPGHFASSLGLFAINIFTNYFTTWGTNAPASQTSATEDFQTIPAAPYSANDFIDINNWWAYREGTAVVERAYQAPSYSSALNQALQLNNLPIARGRVWNTPTALTKGIHNFAFRARLSQNDGLPALYTGGLASLTNGSPWISDYRVTNTINAISMSPANPSVSLLFCYQPGSYPNYNFYELRLTQVSDVSATDSKIQMALNRWNNGVMTRTIKSVVNVSVHQLTNATPLLMDVAWSNAGTNLFFTASATRGGTPICGMTNAADADALRIVNGGTVGFLCSDAEAQISSLGVFAGANLSVGSQIPMVAYNAGNSANYWFFGGTRSDGLNWWQINAAANLARPIPTNAPIIAVNSIRNGAISSREFDVTLYQNNGSFNIFSYSYTNCVQPFSIWDSAYVMLQYTNGDLPIVVDDLMVDPWRAGTRGQKAYTNGIAIDNSGVPFWNWTGTAQQSAWSQNGGQDEQGWLITEGLVVSNAASGAYVSFDTSRANPALEQGVWSPVLTNGLGSIAFNAWVDAGTCIYHVDATSVDGSWSTLQIFTDTVSTASAANPVNHVVAVQQVNMSGRIRIMQTSASSPGAILNINNLVALDYPPADYTTWKAYNCLIASPSVNTSTTARAFQTPTGPSDPEQTCYLNNSPTSGTLISQTANNPYIQSPLVGTGIGEIAFWYRAWDTNAAYVSIRVAKDATVAESQWTVVTNLVVTNLTYQYFDLTSLFDTDDQIMRIYTQTNSVLTNNAGRLCIDNVLVTEPVRAGYEITGVLLQPAQPLMTDQVGVQATIGRFLMNPQGIHVYLSYVVGSTPWGVNNWWGTGNTPNAGVVTMELTNTAPNTYSLTGASLIPPNPIDSVVQYVVWGTNANMVGRPSFQGTNAFTNPSWYAPVDLNNTFSAQGWSPYYYVYSCPPGSVWVNEIQYLSWWPEDEGAYVELIGPANANIGNWTINLMDSSFNVNPSLVISNNFVLTNSATSGWGFFVWGDPGVANVNVTFAGAPGTSLADPGAIQVIRSMGAVEDAVCWDFYYSPVGYVNAGSKNPGVQSPLALQGPITGSVGSNKFDFYWNQPSSGNYTPGAINTDEHIKTNDMVNYFTLTAVVGANGTASLFGAVQIASGASTTIVYTANDWYRIQALTANTTPVTEAANVKSYIQTINNISQNISNNVTFGSATPLQTGYPTNIPTVWLAKWGYGEADLSNHWGHGALGLTQEYWFDVDPTASNTIVFDATAFGVTNRVVGATVQLLIDGNKINYLNGGATLRVMSKINLADNTDPFAVYETNVSATTFDNNGFWYVGGPVTNSHQFFRMEIDNTPTGWSPGP